MGPAILLFPQDVHPPGRFLFYNGAEEGPGLSVGERVHALPTLSEAILAT